jgi:DNA invertase Pin-like site-specific DNA recombinase
MTTIIGYSRTSTTEQRAGYENQVEQLKAAGATKLYGEHISSVAAVRPEFNNMMEYAREGDTICFTKVDRAFRNCIELLTFANKLKARGIHLRILGLDVDTSTPTGWMILTVLSGLAEMERTQMLERQKIGIAKARLDNKYKGRKPTSEDVVAQIKAMKASAVRPTDIARQLKVSRATVYKCLDMAA